MADADGGAQTQWFVSIILVVERWNADTAEYCDSVAIGMHCLLY